MTIRTIEEANQALRPYVPLVSQLTGKDTTLKRIQPLMRLLGNPQDKLKVLHIAGTSGKTSTAYYLSALLTETGRKVGLTVSPHVDSVTERIQINGRPVSDAFFCKELAEFLTIVKKAPEQPSYFELLYAFSLWVFQRQDVDYAVVETGMGGLYDATNVVTRPDKICVLTDIGIDHAHILGATLPEIARQKVGIVHDHNEVFAYAQRREVMAVFEEWIAAHHATLHVVRETVPKAISDLNFSIMPTYQKRNWLLAYNTFFYLSERDSLPHLTHQALVKTTHVVVPGRMDIRRLQAKTIIMDGAHNGQKMAAFIDSFQTLYPNVKPAVMIALKHNKDYQEVATLLANVAARIIITTFHATQDLPVQSLDPHTLAEAFPANLPKQVIVNPEAALKALIQTPEPIGIITGSFYLLSQVRNNIDRL